LPTEYPFHVVVDRLRRRVEVEVLTSETNPDITIAYADVHRPGMGLMGYVAGFHRERLQVFGRSELGYLESIDADAQREAVRRILDLDVPGIFLADWPDVAPALVEEARRRQIPVAQVRVPTDELIRDLRAVLTDLFAPRATRHGTLVDVYGVGMLITGRSGIGKSETALDLVERGHRLVADDLVNISRRNDVLVGMGRANTQHLMEIRGLGIVDLLPAFGVRAIRMQKRIELEMRLEEWDEDKDYDRHGLDREMVDILGVEIPLVIVPIFPGKNITVIAETIALDFMLKVYGIDSAADFNRKLIETMAENGRTRAYLEHDTE